MSDLFLTGEQVRELTGYMQPSAQVRWLRMNGMTHWVRADGHPKVPVSAIRENAVTVSGCGAAIPDFESVRVSN